MRTKERKQGIECLRASKLIVGRVDSSDPTEVQREAVLAARRGDHEHKVFVHLSEVGIHSPAEKEAQVKQHHPLVRVPDEVYLVDPFLQTHIFHNKAQGKSSWAVHLHTVHLHT